jgi:TolB-like protein/Tfp pilus assembly protein PilF
MSFFGELKRRNVIRVAGVYIVVSWVLVQVATALEESLGLPDWFDGLIVALLLIGLPVALIFAWAFELTPEGVVRTEAVPEEQSIATETGRKLDFALAFAIIALVIVIVWQQSSRPVTPAPVADADQATEVEAAAGPVDASVAVLPFSDMSPEGDQEYFSDGLTEEILNLLVRADAIEVVSRTSSFQFKNSNLGIPEIAAELNVRHIVEGSVRKSGNTIRVTAQLIDAVTDRHLWSDTYDRPLTVENLFEIQDDVANSIFEALGEELGLLEEVDLRAKRTTDDVDAYELFLRARALYQARRDLDLVDELLAEAVAMDPDFAEAWAYRAPTQQLMYSYGHTDRPQKELNDRGLAFAQRALALDPDNATALATVPFIQIQQATWDYADHDWAGIIAGFTKALDADPRNASALIWRGIAFAWLGQMERGLEDFRSCVRYEPYYVPCLDNLHWYLADMGRDEEALQVLLGAMNAGVSKILYANLTMLARNGNELMFKAVTNNVLALRDWRHHDQLYDAFRNLDADHSELVQSIMEFYEANPDRSADFINPTIMALGGVPLDPTVIGLWSSSSGHTYRQTAHFRDFLRKSGLYDYFRQTGWPDACRPIGDDDFECN